MSDPPSNLGLFEPSRYSYRFYYAVAVVSVLAISPVVLWPNLRHQLLENDFLPHRYCYLSDAGLVWTHVVADSLIALAYLAISVTLLYLVNKARSDIPMHWMFLAFGLFIVACGGTHFLEVVTVWVPVYVLSAAVKLFTAAASLTTAAVLPFTIPHILALVQQARASEQNMARLRASEERKEALLREVHHRVKNNLAIICSLFYLQSTRTRDEKTVNIFRQMESRVHSMALVHESLYGSENLARIDFAEYARTLANNILSAHRTSADAVKLQSEMDSVTMSVDLAVPCGLILNELMSNAFKHGFPNGGNGEIRLRLRKEASGTCSLCVEDSGVGVSGDVDLAEPKSLGLRLVMALTRQIRGSFQLANTNPGTAACLRFMVDTNDE
jgi:two-component sensor histidine kinase